MPLNILLLSTYELGHQPLGLAQPAAHLAAAGHLVRCQDLAVDSLNDPWVRESDLIGISVPMHTAARLGVRLISRLRVLNLRSEEHTSELQSHSDLVCRLLLEKK